MTAKMTYRELHQELHTGRGIHRNNEYMGLNSGSFYQIRPIDRDITQEDLTGWKFHLSIDEQDVEKAWDLLHDKLTDQKFAAKVAKPDTIEKFGDAENSQRSKMITIYEDSIEPRDMPAFLRDVERTLRENGIRPGHDVNHDRKIDGSQYVHYRNDRTLEGQYNDSAEINSYNPHGFEDPYAQLDLTNVDRTPFENLSTMKGGIQSRYGIEPQWGKHAGHAFTRMQNAENAHELSRVLNEFGIKTFQPQSNPDIVAIPEDALEGVDAAAFDKCEKLTTALAMQDSIKNHHDATLAQANWQVNTGKESSAMPDPHIRGHFADEATAREMADRLTQQTGIPSSYAHKTVNGEQRHMVVMPMDNLEHVQRNVGIMQEQQREAAYEATREVTRVMPQDREVTQVQGLER